MSSQSISDHLLERIIALEHWLEQAEKPLPMLPVRVLGYALLVCFLVASNLVALCRWPITYLLSKLRTGGDSPSTQQRVVGGEPISGNADMAEKLITSGRPVLVDFWAAWCGPCIMMNDSLHKAAQDAGEKCLVVKIDTMQHPKMAKGFAVRGLPTLILFAHGKEVERHAGALSYGGIKALLERHGL